LKTLDLPRLAVHNDEHLDIDDFCVMYAHPVAPMFSLCAVNQDKSVGIVIRLRVEWPMIRRSFPGMGQEIFLCTVSRPALGPTQPSIQRVPSALSSAEA
jgi:hypothetical protein